MYTSTKRSKYLPQTTYFATLITLFFALVTMTTTAYADNLPASPEDIRPILIGQPIPKLILKDVKNKSFNLNKALTQKPTLLIFYRGGWCPYCNTHLSDLRKIEGELLSMGFQIIAISPDQPKFLQETLEKQKLGYQLLSDSSMAAAKALGLAYKVDNGMLEKLNKYGIDIEKSAGKKHHLLPVPAALLINTVGEVSFTFVAPNYKTRISNGVILAAAKALLNEKK